MIPPFSGNCDDDNNDASQATTTSACSNTTPPRATEVKTKAEAELITSATVAVTDLSTTDTGNETDNQIRIQYHNCGNHGIRYGRFQWWCDSRRNCKRYGEDAIVVVITEMEQGR